MILIILIALVVILAFFPTFRCAVLHPFALTWYGAKDMYYYFRRLRFNLCGSGELVAYTGLFGKGKTLSAVYKVVSAYRRYDGKRVWCSRRKKIVTQRIKVISNVSLALMCVPSINTAAGVSAPALPASSNIHRNTASMVSEVNRCRKL